MLFVAKCLLNVGIQTVHVSQHCSQQNILLATTMLVNSRAMNVQTKRQTDEHHVHMWGLFRLTSIEN